MPDKLVKITEEMHKILSKNAALDKQTKKDYFESMIVFFDKNGISPRSMEDSPVAQITKVKDQLIGFIRTQEKTKLNPIVDDLELNIKLLRDHLKAAVVKADFVQSEKRIAKYHNDIFVKINNAIEVSNRSNDLSKLETQQETLLNKFQELEEKHRRERGEMMKLWHVFVREMEDNDKGGLKALISNGHQDLLRIYTDKFVELCT